MSNLTQECTRWNL